MRAQAHEDRPVLLLQVLVGDVLADDRGEAQLHAERDRAQVTLHSIAEGVITTDERGRIETLNPVAEALTGWTRKAAVGDANLLLIAKGLSTAQAKSLLASVRKPVLLHLSSAPDAELADLVKKTESLEAMR